MRTITIKCDECGTEWTDEQRRVYTLMRGYKEGIHNFKDGGICYPIAIDQKHLCQKCFIKAGGQVPNCEMDKEPETVPQNKETSDGKAEV